MEQIIRSGGKIALAERWTPRTTSEPTPYEIMLPAFTKVPKGSFLWHPWKTFKRCRKLRNLSKKVIDIRGVKFIPTEKLREGGLTVHTLGEKYIRVYMPLRREISKSTLLHELGHVEFFRMQEHLQLVHPDKFATIFRYRYDIKTQEVFAQALADRFALKHVKKFGLSQDEANLRESLYIKRRKKFLYLKQKP